MGHRCTLVRQRDRVLVFVHGPQWLMHLDERAMRQPSNDAGLDPVGEYLPIVALQAEADVVGQVVGQRRQQQQRDARYPDERVDGQMQRVRDDIIATGDQQHQEKRDGHHPQRGTDRSVPGSLQ